MFKYVCVCVCMCRTLILTFNFTSALNDERHSKHVDLTSTRGKQKCSTKITTCLWQCLCNRINYSFWSTDCMEQIVFVHTHSHGLASDKQRPRRWSNDATALTDTSPYAVMLCAQSNVNCAITSWCVCVCVSVGIQRFSRFVVDFVIVFAESQRAQLATTANTRIGEANIRQICCVCVYIQITGPPVSCASVCLYCT